MGEAFVLILFGYLLYMIVGFTALACQSFWHWLYPPPSWQHQEIVRKARRERLTTIERERRLRAVRKYVEVPRSRWPTSYR